MSTVKSRWFLAPASVAAGCLVFPVLQLVAFLIYEQFFGPLSPEEPLVTTPDLAFGLLLICLLPGVVLGAASGVMIDAYRRGSVKVLRFFTALAALGVFVYAVWFGDIVSGAFDRNGNDGLPSLAVFFLVNVALDWAVALAIAGKIALNRLAHNAKRARRET